MFVCCCFFHEHIQEIKKVGKELGIVPTVIRDEELKTRGFGGGSGLFLADPGLRSSPGYLGGRGAPGCTVCRPKLRPKLRPEGTQPASSPEARPWEADHLWGREEAAIQILIQILEASGSKASPAHSLCSLPHAAVLAPWLTQQGLSVPRIHKFTSTSRPALAALSVWDAFPRGSLTIGPSYPARLGHLLREPFLIARSVLPQLPGTEMR